MKMGANRRKDRAIGRKEVQLGTIHRACRIGLSLGRDWEPARMDRTRRLFQLLFVGLLVAGMTLPVSAFPAADQRDIGPAQTDAEDAQGQSDAVSVGVGQQLSTVLAVTSDDVKTEMEETAFEVSFETEAEEARVRTVANRSVELRDRAESIVADYDEANRAFEAGEISASEFARRIAALNARAENVLRSYERLQKRSQSVSALELRAAGVNRTALRAAIADLDAVTGAGPTALLRQFTGLSRGSVELRTNGGLRIEVEADDGELSREVTRRGDEDPSFTVPQATALETASGALSNRSWTLERASVHEEQGYYRFRYRLATAEQVGRAEVRVDGSSGTVIRIEEVVNARDDEDRDDDRDERDGDADADLVLLVVTGQPAPGEQITLEVRQDGQPAANATISVNDRRVGTTDANGRIAVTLPQEEAEIVAERGGAEGELEFEFEEDEDTAVFRKLDTTATLDNDTVTVTVTFDGRGVANATVFANDRRVGRTGEEGTVRFQLPAGEEELEIEIVKGEFEAELEYRIDGDALVLTEEAHSGDGDKAHERDDEDDEADEHDDDDDRERDSDDRDREEDGTEDRDDRDRDDDDEAADLVLRIVSGDPAPGASVTLAVSQNGSPVADARISINDRFVGITDTDGRIHVTLPDDEAEIRAESGDAEGELELEFEADDESDETETPEPDEGTEDSVEDDDSDDEDEDSDDEDADVEDDETPTDG